MCCDNNSVDKLLYEKQGKKNVFLHVLSLNFFHW